MKLGVAAVVVVGAAEDGDGDVVGVDAGDLKVIDGGVGDGVLAHRPGDDDARFLGGGAADGDGLIVEVEDEAEAFAVEEHFDGGKMGVSVERSASPVADAGRAAFFDGEADRLGDGGKDVLRRIFGEGLKAVGVALERGAAAGVGCWTCRRIGSRPGCGFDARRRPISGTPGAKALERSSWICAAAKSPTRASYLARVKWT